MLRQVQGDQLFVKATIEDVYRHQDLVFPNAIGDPLDPVTLTRNFKGFARQAGLDKVRLHDLRHFHASLLLTARTHLKVVQERLGHASIAITADTYSHVAPALQRSAAEDFSAAIEATRPV